MLKTRISTHLRGKKKHKKIQTNIHITLHGVHLNNASLQESVSVGLGSLWPSMIPQFHMHRAQ